MTRTPLTPLLALCAIFASGPAAATAPLAAISQGKPVPTPLVELLERFGQSSAAFRTPMAVGHGAIAVIAARTQASDRTRSGATKQVSRSSLGVALPEPGTLVLLGIGLLAVGIMGFRDHRRRPGSQGVEAAEGDSSAKREV